MTANLDPEMAAALLAYAVACIVHGRTVSQCVAMHKPPPKPAEVDPDEVTEVTIKRLEPEPMPALWATTH